MIDEIDRKIVAELAADSKMPMARIAAECGVTRQTVASRIKKLEKGGVIKKHKVVIDLEKLGLHSYLSCSLSWTSRTRRRRLNLSGP